MTDKTAGPGEKLSGLSASRPMTSLIHPAVYKYVIFQFCIVLSAPASSSSCHDVSLLSHHRQAVHTADWLLGPASVVESIKR